MVNDCTQLFVLQHLAPPAQVIHYNMNNHIYSSQNTVACVFSDLFIYTVVKVNIFTFTAAFKPTACSYCALNRLEISSLLEPITSDCFPHV